MLVGEDGSITLNLKVGYYGEVKYQMQYNGVEGPLFHWLFVDFETLSTYANRNGFVCEMILEGANYEFLALLRRGIIRNINQRTLFPTTVCFLWVKYRPMYRQVPEYFEIGVNLINPVLR